MKTYIATLQIDDGIEILGDVEATVNYVYRDNGTKYKNAEHIIFEAVEGRLTNDDQRTL